jgi:pimeloyl-ACP methyl ester carboxylesterase
MRLVEADRPQGLIFYVHGLGESGLCLEHLMAHPLLKGFTHIAPDLPGYGKSPWTHAPLSVVEYADAVAGWISLYAADAVFLLGHSLGGVIGTCLCERHPELVRLFVNVEGNISAEDCTLSCRIAGHTLEDFLAYGYEMFCEETYRRGMHEKALRMYYASMRMCDPRQLYASSTELMDLSAREDLGLRLAGLKVPACYLWGDPRGTQGHSLGLLEAAGVPLVKVDDAGHWPFIDQPDAIARHLLAVLETNLR